ncbi:hypothetical protein NOVOSPHI9U_560002 [Novosphingobium sp. 9U]|nr:hypothetical protein NOVOSPHI9U_560002 [Novosphingobium sp. 9U]
MRTVGLVAGFGLVGVGLKFLFNGDQAVLSNNPVAYDDDVNFTSLWAYSGFPDLTYSRPGPFCFVYDC